MSGALPRDRGWRTTHSLWLLPNLLCCGFAAWAGFLYIGLRTKNRAWLISSFAYFAGAVAAVVLLSMSGPSDEDVAKGSAPPTSTQDALGDWGAGLMIALWMGGIVHSLLARPHFLYALDQLERTRYSTVPMYPNPIQQQSAPTWLTGDPQQYWAQNPQTTAPPPMTGYEPTVHAQPVQPPPAPAPAPQPAAAQGLWPGTSTPPVEPVKPIAPADPTVQWQDAGSVPRIPVNSASFHELSALGLTDEVVAAVIQARIRAGGFRDVQEFATAAQLKPHELQRIKDRLEFSGAPGTPNRSFGRKLDL